MPEMSTDWKKKSETYLGKEALSTREEVVEAMTRLWRPEPGREEVPLQSAEGRFVAEPLYSKNTLPVFRASRMDGVAVRASDFAGGIPDVSGWREGIDYAAADTGDDFPDGFDAVIRIEDAVFEEGRLVGFQPGIHVEPGGMVKPAGGNLKSGELLLERGARIGPLQLQLLAQGGVTQVPVIRRPRVAYIPTGSELVPPEQRPERGDNVESNGLMIGALLGQMGAEVRPWPIVKDSCRDLEGVLDEALAWADIVLMNGGSSMGSEDFVSTLVGRRADFCRHGVKSVPGMPVAAALVGGKPVVDMPGPPFAAYAVTNWLVQALVGHWFGGESLPPATVRATLTCPLDKPKPFAMYTRVHVERGPAGGLTATPLRRDVRDAEADRLGNGLFIGAPGRDHYDQGEEIQVQWI